MRRVFISIQRWRLLMAILQREIGVVKLSLTLCEFQDLLINTDLAFLKVRVLSCTSRLACVFPRRPLLVCLDRNKCTVIYSTVLFFTC